MFVSTILYYVRTSSSALIIYPNQYKYLCYIIKIQKYILDTYK